MRFFETFINLFSILKCFFSSPAYSQPDEHISIFCCKGHITQKFKMSFKRLAWIALCFVVDISETNVKIFVKDSITVIDLENKQKNSKEPLKISKGGNLVIGQEQDKFRGGFNRLETISGVIVDMFLSDKILDQAFINDYLNCKVLYPKEYLVSFEDIRSDFDIFEDTEIIDKKTNEICLEKEMNLIFLPDSVSFSTAEEFCHAMNGTLPVPLNKKQNEFIYHNSNTCKKMGLLKTWIGIKSNRDGDTEPYHYLSKKHLNFSSWEKPLIRVNDVNCALAFLGQDLNRFNINGWHLTSCEDSLCMSCSFTDQAVLRTRGICEESNFDRSFIVHGYFNDKMFFSGEYSSTIRWEMKLDKNDNERGFWLLEVGGKNNTFAEMDMVSEFDYPIGIHTWKSVGGNCKTDEDGRMQLLLTACDEDMFTCGDGSCIHMEKRCDLQVDCKDESDELQCFIVKTPIGYDSGKPPPRLDPSFPVMVEATMFIYSFHKIDLINDHITLEIMYKRRWFDSNLMFKNLKKDKSHNMFDLSAIDIWYPNTKIIGEDNCTGETTILDKRSWAERNSNPLVDDEQNVLKGIYLICIVYYLHGGILVLPTH